MVKVEKSFVDSPFKIEGLSLSGIRTAFALPELSLGFDVAQGFPFSIPLKTYAISHGHLDHAAGIPYLISQKAMNSLPPGQFLMPPTLVAPLQQIMNLWQEIEKHEYKYNFIPVSQNFEYELNGQHFLKAFSTVHRIESFGYSVVERKKKLKKQFHHLSQSELKKMGESGVLLQDTIETPLVSFTGDTQIEFLDLNPWVGTSKVLLLEATYLDQQKSIQDAKKWGHTHLDEIIERLPQIQSEKIILIHASSRYSDHAALEILKKKIPTSDHDRVLLFPGR